MKRIHPWLAISFLCLGLSLCALGALALGSSATGWGNENELLFLRLPRVLAAVIAGIALGIGGASQQGIFRNPLADPGLTGVFGGALFGIAVLLSSTDTIVWENPWLIPSAAFTGALLLSLFLVILGGKGSTARLLLTGLGLNAFAAAGTLILAARNSQTRDVLVSGMAGDWLGTATLPLIAVPVILCLTASVFLCLQSRNIDRLSLGEDVALTLGCPVQQVRRHSILFTALAAAAATCLVGQIAFIGLLAPHLARAILGPRHATALPLAGLLGGILLLTADTLGRTLWPQTPLSAAAMTALLGAPVFVWIASRQHE
jgi:iron complex transport system permease protein